MKPVSTCQVRPSTSTSWVSVWPPRRSSASNSTTSCARASRHAAASAPMPLPTTAMRMSARPARKQLRRYRLEVAHQAQHLQHAQPVEGEVELPPAEALARAAREEVVVVVPAFAEGQQGQPGVVAAVVAGGEAAASPAVR